MIWYDMILCGVIWYDMIEYDCCHTPFNRDGVSYYITPLNNNVTLIKKMVVIHVWCDLIVIG